MRSLRSEIRTSGFWSSAGYASELVTRLAANLILTRLLFPEAFGLMAVTISLISAFLLVSDFGIRAFVIRDSRANTRELLCATWTFKILTGFAIWLVLLSLVFVSEHAGLRNLLPLHSVFLDPLFTWFLIISSIVIPIKSAESTALILYYKNLELRELILLDVSSKLIGIFATLIIAYYTRSLWALLIGHILSTSVKTLASHLMPQLPKMELSYSPKIFFEVVHFGKWIILSSSSHFLMKNFDKLFIGIVAPAQFVGIYSISRMLSDVAENAVGKINSDITLPVLRKISIKNPEELNNKFYSFQFPLSFFSIFLASIMITCGETIVKILYDPRYHEAGRILEIISISILFFHFSIIKNRFLLDGDARYFAIINLTESASFILFLVSGYWVGGLTGALYGIAMHRTLPVIMILHESNKRGWVDFRRELRATILLICSLVLGSALNYLLNFSALWLNITYT